MLMKVFGGGVLRLTYHHWERDAGYNSCEAPARNLDEAHCVGHTCNIAHTEAGVRLTSRIQLDPGLEYPYRPGALCPTGAGQRGDYEAEEEKALLHCDANYRDIRWGRLRSKAIRERKIDPHGYN
jgi:hypothetical protein